MKDVGGAGFAGSSPPFRGRERAAVDVDVGPERRSPCYHETCLALESVDERKVGFTKNTATRHRRVGGRAVTVTAMRHRQRYRVIEKEKTR